MIFIDTYWKRVTLGGALYQYYNVKEYDNGSIMLEPRELTVPEVFSYALNYKNQEEIGQLVIMPVLIPEFTFEGW